MDEGVPTAGRTIGRQLRSIRHARQKSLRVVAGLAGISAGHLSRLENGERSLDRMSLISGLANALQVAPSDLIGPHVPAPGEEGTTDAAVDVVRHVLMSVTLGHPGGEVQPVGVLATRVSPLAVPGVRANTSWSAPLSRP
ncbi:MAG: helix-turn-helix domain-containing protein [Actinomycetota bacterium]|nr:helix-turn-helix domain-containing protein [Actinomycetota bacterium]